MTTTLERIRQRRELLTARAELQRAVLRLRMQPLHNAMERADRIKTALRRLQHHPAVVLLVMAGVVMLARRRLWRVLRLGWSGWQVYRMVTRSKPA